MLSVKTESNTRLDDELKDIERYKDDSNKCYQAIRKVNSHKPQKPLAIFNKQNQFIASETEQLHDITEYFIKLISSNDPVKYVAPVKMDPLFSEGEISKASTKLKDGRATIDGVHAEFIKHSSSNVHAQTADLLNKTSETGKYPDDIRHGILNPLPKPPKKNEQVNVRPIILLSVLRKILTIVLIDRCWERLKTCIPVSQAAYQSGRSTTEQVFAVKILAEKAITSENYDIFILMLDMSKAFDTVNRNKLMTILKSVLSDCELHRMHILINTVNLNVRLGNNVGENITTSVGICQGDCLSALLFIVYLASSIRPLPSQIQQVDYNRPLWSALRWLVDKDKHTVEVDPKYADDITFVRTVESKINQVERLMPEMLKENNLYINPMKTEKYTISRTSNSSWKKKCKLFGSLLDSDKDIICRKGLAIDSFKTLENIFKSRHISEVIQLRIFKAYIESIFLYNSEIWALTKSPEDKIDSSNEDCCDKLFELIGHASYQPKIYITSPT